MSFPHRGDGPGTFRECAERAKAWIDQVVERLESEAALVPDTSYPVFGRSNK